MPVRLLWHSTLIMRPFQPGDRDGTFGVQMLCMLSLLSLSPLSSSDPFRKPIILSEMPFYVAKCGNGGTHVPVGQMTPVGLGGTHEPHWDACCEWCIRASMIPCSPFHPHSPTPLSHPRGEHEERSLHPSEDLCGDVFAVFLPSFLDCQCCVWWDTVPLAYTRRCPSNPPVCYSENLLAAFIWRGALKKAA